MGPAIQGQEWLAVKSTNLFMGGNVDVQLSRLVTSFL